MAEPYTVYKITILYMLDKADFPLSNTQITEFFLDMDYTNYFAVQEVLSNLVDTSQINPETTHGTTYYTLSPAGRESLGFFKTKITEAIEQDVESFFRKHSWDFRRENSVLADFRYTRDCNYEVTCQVRTDNVPIIKLTLTAATKEQAEAMCRNWKESNTEIYAYLMDTLVQ